MSKEYLVLKSGKVVYTQGHYDKEGAEAVVRHLLAKHPRSEILIVRIEERFGRR